MDASTIAKALALCAVSFLASCSAVVVPEEQPIFADTVKGNYISLADCVFPRLQNQMGQIARTHLESRKTIQLARGDYNLIYWTLELQEVGNGSTKAVFRSGRAIWGTDFYANQVVPHVTACSAHS